MTKELGESKKFPELFLSGLWKPSFLAAPFGYTLLSYVTCASATRQKVTMKKLPCHLAPSGALRAADWYRCAGGIRGGNGHGEGKVAVLSSGLSMKAARARLSAAASATAIASLPAAPSASPCVGSFTSRPRSWDSWCCQKTEPDLSPTSLLGKCPWLWFTLDGAWLLPRTSPTTHSMQIAVKSVQ